MSAAADDGLSFLESPAKGEGVERQSWWLGKLSWGVGTA
ncbi:hypothetical protein SAMN04489732_123128 [Amycolatopsis saalfeldensis]|uniref:Uncharacterized protein n=1 Tax=Amycolatopsis saalfeldensis TaxID=394193 RepID=A0A1H8YLE9_9PSEU|nr:hypothetical protein SAMN04489732_123128 [Amycolatopsis saalfeldensis]